MGYEIALKNAQEKLRSLSPERVCKICDVKFDLATKTYIINSLGKDYYLSLYKENPEMNKMLEILFLHYLCSEGGKKFTEKDEINKVEREYITIQEIPGARFYANKFVERAVTPFLKCFEKNPKRLIDVALKLGGEKVKGSDFIEVELDMLPNVRLDYAVCPADEEFPETSGNIFFDNNAQGWLSVEDLVVAATLTTHELCRNFDL